MENDLIMKTSDKLVIIGIVASLIFSIVNLLGLHDILFHPDVQVDVQAGDRPNGNYSIFLIAIKNIGNSPATNIRLTLNPSTDMIKSTVGRSTEKVDLVQGGSRSLVATIPRLTANDYVIIATLQHSVARNTQLMVYASYDQGSAIQYNTKDNGLRIITNETSFIQTSQFGESIFSNLP